MDRRRLLFASLAAAAAAPLDSARATDAAADIPQKFAAALSAGDMTAFAALIADDYVNHQTSAAAPAPSGKSARQATLDFFTNRVNALTGLKVTIEVSLSQGDLCAASFVYAGVHNAVYYGVAPTGRKLRFTSCDIFRIVNGKIAEHWGMGRYRRACWRSSRPETGKESHGPCARKNLCQGCRSSWRRLRPAEDFPAADEARRIKRRRRRFHRHG